MSDARGNSFAKKNSSYDIQESQGLPYDVLALIFSQLNLVALSALIITNKNFHQFLVSKSANLIWQNKTANLFPRHYQQLVKENQFPENYYETFMNYYKNDDYKNLTREQKIIFSYLKEENVSALDKYNAPQNQNNSHEALQSSRIRPDQIPFQFLEWVAEYASQAFKDYLYQNIYQPIVDAKEINDGLFLFPRNGVVSEYKRYQDADVFLYYNQKVQFLLLLFLNQSDEKMQEIFGESFKEVLQFNNRFDKFATLFPGLIHEKYFQACYWHFGKYGSLEAIEARIKNSLKWDFIEEVYQFCRAVIERGDQKILNCVLKWSWESLMMMAIQLNHLETVDYVIKHIKKNWKNYLNFYYIIQHGVPEVAEFLFNQHQISLDVNGKYHNERYDDAYLTPLSCAIHHYRVDWVKYLLERNAKLIRAIDEKDFSTKAREWNKLNDRYRNFKKPIYSIEKAKIFNSPPRVYFQHATKENTSLPNAMVNHYMLELLLELYLYLWRNEVCWSKREGFKHLAIQDLIIYVVNHQNDYFDDLVEQWKNLPNSTVEGKTNLQVVREQESELSGFVEETVSSFIVPGLNLFSSTAAKWVADKAKTDTELFIDHLVKHACLYTTPKVEALEQNEGEKKSFKYTARQ